MSKKFNTTLYVLCISKFSPGENLSVFDSAADLPNVQVFESWQDGWHCLKIALDDTDPVELLATEGREEVRGWSYEPYEYLKVIYQNVKYVYFSVHVPGAPT